MKAKKEIGELPKGVVIGEKPDNIELYQRGRERWIQIVEALRSLKATEDLRYDLSSDDNPKKAKGKIIGGIKYAAQQMGEKRPVRCVLINSILHVWLR